MKVFGESQVKENRKFFLAGRGGETNLHVGNFEVRRLVLENAETYASLSPRERGQKFSLKVLEDDLAGFTFVVKLSYLWKNIENRKIASNKIASVVSEHGSLGVLKSLSPSAYVTIGETWCLNIIGAILRQASCRMDIKKAKVTTQPKSKSSRRRTSSKRITRACTRIQVEETQQNSVEFVDTPGPCVESSPLSSSVIVPENVDSSRTRNNITLTTPPASELKVTDPATINKTRRVSLCQGSVAATVQSMSLRDATPFFPLRHQSSVSDTRNSCFVSLDQLPPAFHPPLSEATRSSAFITDDHLEPFDPFDVILNDWDTKDWPHLDLHDLLSV